MKIKISTKEYINAIKDYNFPGIEDKKFGRYFYFTSLLTTVSVAVAVNALLLLIWGLLFLILKGEVINQDFFNQMSSNLLLAIPISTGFVIVFGHISMVPKYRRSLTVYNQLDELVKNNNIPKFSLLLENNVLNIARIGINKEKYSYLVHKVKKYQVKQVRMQNSKDDCQFAILQTSKELVPIYIGNKKLFPKLEKFIKEWTTNG